MMEWINANEEWPEKSGKYLVYCEDDFCTVVNFSKKWNKFNSSDRASHCRDAFEDVLFWAEVEIPETVACSS